MVKFFKVVEVSSTKHLPIPLQLGEIVMEINNPDYEDSQYMQVYHGGKGRGKSSFSRSYFKRYLPKKEELKELIKNKGRYNEES